MLQVFRAYEERKRSSAYLDYDDILHVFVRRLHERPEARQKIRARFDHILVDEMQDTNPLQWLILDAIRDPAKLFCVGDDAQSIYAFRGADFRNVHLFSERVPGGRVLKLERNYRSTQPTLDLANWLLERSPLGYGKRLTAARGGGCRPRLIDFCGDLDDARWIAGDIIERHEDGAAWHSHMVLTRTAWGARALEAFFVEKNVLYRFIGGTSLLQSAHAKDLFALARASESLKDELAWMRYLTLWPKIGDRTAARIVDQLKSCASAEEGLAAVEQRLSDRPGIAAALRKVRENRDAPSRAVAAAARALSPLMKTRYERWGSRKRDFALLRRLAAGHRSLRAFIETYTLDPISESMAQRLEGDDAVTLITVHSAKGTEADVCYIIQVQPGVYPHIRSLGDADAEEEERRILYVAMTRAKNELILTRTNRVRGRFVPIGGRDAVHSDEGQGYLLEALPEDLVDAEIAGLDSGWDGVIPPFSRED